jgi:carboxyl-terminal processing protease
MHRLRKFWPGLLGLALAVALGAGGETVKSDVPQLLAAGPAHLRPGPADPRIALVAARLLEEYHYLQHPLDQEMSGKFFDGYVNSLDPRHENFLQSDLAEFAVYRTNLDRLTIGHGGQADLTPAFAVYDRFARRIQQHNDYVNGQLDQNKFKFTTDEKIVVDRRHAPFPKDLKEAEALWFQRLCYEYLQEKLSREIKETNDTLLTVKLPADSPKEIAETLKRHYRWNLHMTTNWDSDGVLQAYLNGLAHAYDPHSDYLSAPHARDFSISMNLALFGIGAQLGEDDGYCTIRSLVRGGPAFKSKQIAEKDRVIAVAQGTNAPVDVVDMDLEKVVSMIRGAKGTEVRLTISPESDRAARKIVSLVRDEIKLEESQASAKLLEYPDGQRIGIIDLPSFYATVDLGNDTHTTPKYTSVDVARLVKRLKQEKVTGIIIDLRSNPGGSLEEAIKFTGLFIKDGPIVQARNPDGQLQIDADPDPAQLYDGPLVVMVNRFSASASEIAAAALQDYGRALIVGDTSTHGKGTVQNLNPLKPFPGTSISNSDPGVIKITIRKFYRVSGGSTQFKGVTPDIVLPDVLNYSDQVGEQALENALAWDTISPASYEKFNLVEPFLARLKARSEPRVATNEDFLYVKQDIAQFQKQQAEKTISLNEHDTIKERERNYAQAKARENERLARKADGVKTYQITLKNVDEPGLQEFKPEQDEEVTATTNQPNATVTLTTTTTNSVATNLTRTATGTAKKADKKSAPPFDPMLDETERILLDYISLLTKNGVLMAHQ